MYTQKIAHLTNFTDVAQLMVEVGEDEVRKHLDTGQRKVDYFSHVAISEYLIQSVCGLNKISSSLLKKLYFVLYWQIN